jgi:hypothetical protein
MDHQRRKEHLTGRVTLGIAIPNFIGLGDAIQFSCIPENFYKNTGKRLVDCNGSYVFDHNPYVLRGNAQPHKVFNPWGFEWKSGHNFRSKSSRWCNGLGLEKCYLRHPRLYIYEDVQNHLNSPTVSVHCSGKTRGNLSDKVISTIKKNYQDFDIVQVGGTSDRKTPFIDRRGLPFFESVKIIANSQIFIGIDSAMYHVARCYPRVRKKIIIQNDHFDEEELGDFFPYKKGFDDWIDFDSEYFNEFEYDIGITNALHKV